MRNFDINFLVVNDFLLQIQNGGVVDYDDVDYYDFCDYKLGSLVVVVGNWCHLLEDYLVM